MKTHGDRTQPKLAFSRATNKPLNMKISRIAVWEKCLYIHTYIHICILHTYMYFTYISRHIHAVLQIDDSMLAGDPCCQDVPIVVPVQQKKKVPCLCQYVFLLLASRLPFSFPFHSFRFDFLARQLLLSRLAIASPSVSALPFTHTHIRWARAHQTRKIHSRLYKRSCRQVYLTFILFSAGVQKYLNFRHNPFSVLSAGTHQICTACCAPN